MGADGTSGNDTLLQTFLQEQDERRAQELLAGLVRDQAAPVIVRVLGGKRPLPPGSSAFAVVDPSEVEAQVIVQLVDRLQRLRGDPSPAGIRDFRGYVAAVARRAWAQQLRELQPERETLRNRIRYLLGHRPGFARIEDDRRGPLAALAGRNGGASKRKASTVERRTPPGPLGGSLSLEDRIEGLLAQAGNPVPVRDVVRTLAQTLSPRAATVPFEESRPVGVVDPTRQIELRLDLAKLWLQIRCLPAAQRSALLLNLRDREGRDVIGLLPLLGVATIRNIAEVLSMTPLELAELWPRLPMEDTAIGLRLGRSRQQVINLRKAARARLARWLRREGAGKSPADER